MMLRANNTAAPRDPSREPAAGMPRGEGGFILMFVMFLLAVCMVIGVAATHTSLDELDISTNEVISKRLFSLAQSGIALASIPLVGTQGRGAWTSGKYINERDPWQEDATGTIQVMDGDFLTEGVDADTTYLTGWNNSGKWLSAPASKKAKYKPIDDPFQPRKADGSLTDSSIEGVDLVVNVNNLLTMWIDVDKTGIHYFKGGNSEFGTGVDGGAGVTYELIYVMDCKATLPGRDITSADSPAAEMVLGYRFVPSAGM